MIVQYHSRLVSQEMKSKTYEVWNWENGPLTPDICRNHYGKWLNGQVILVVSSCSDLKEVAIGYVYRKKGSQRNVCRDREEL